jgi:hypothetical protein
VIDIHTHLHPPRLFKAIRRWFDENSDWHLKHPTDPDAVAGSLKHFGVQRFVFCSYAHKPGMARELNSWLAETSRRLNRFGLPLATVHPDDDDCLSYFEEALTDGCVGLKIHEDVQGIRLDDSRLESVLSRLSAHNGFVLAHIGSIPFRADSNDGPVRIDNVAKRHPDLNIVIAHLGVPDTNEYLDLIERHANLYLDTTMALTPSALKANIDRRDLAHFADRIVFGSDHPNLPYPYEDEVAAVKNLKLSQEAEDKVFFGNAEGILAPFL